MIADSLTLTPVSKPAAAFAVSRDIRDLAPAASSARPAALPQNVKVERFSGSPAPARYPENVSHDSDKAMARQSLVPMPSATLAVDGLSNFDNITAYNSVIIPPDTIGDVGPDHYVQAVNSLLLIFDKAGGRVTAPIKFSEFFAPLATPCSTRFDGEPNVLYDPLADRWLISQYCSNFPPFRQMIAVSKTGDPAGAYYLYEFVMPNIRLNDFAKFGVWPDGYYMSTEEFTGSDYSGAGIFAFDRTKMLTGDPTASYIYFNRPSATTARLGNLLPSDIDGLRPPQAGAPNTFIGYTATEYGDAQDALRLFDFHADFANPSNSTFTERPESPLSVAAFDPTSLDGRADIIQPAPGERLDANSDRLNYRAAYRNFGVGESIVVNQTVRLSLDPYRAGVRVYELKRTAGPYAVTEQSTIGNSSTSRWIGSVAQDNQGNMAVGYNLVADNKDPSIVYSGKLASEPAGTFRDEATLVEGTGVQKAFGWRWGDYSGMSVDPVDDCTFWMTGEYYTLESQNFSDYTWLTRIGKFKFAECAPAPRAVITGVATNASNGQPIAGAKVSAFVYSRTTAANGSYGNMAVLPGTYTVTASANGYRSQSFNVSPTDGQSVTQNFSLQPVAVLVNTGVQVTAESCGTNGAPDPGETVTVNIALQNTGTLATQNLTGTLLSGGGVTNPGPPQVYGNLAAGGLAVTRPFSFTVSPTFVCGGQITLFLHLQDGAEDLGFAVIVQQTGTPKIAFFQNFDRGQQAQPPPRWTRSDVYLNPDEPIGERTWRVSTAHTVSGTKAVHAIDSHYLGLSELTSPVFTVTSTLGRLTFKNWYELETTFLRNRLYDGAVLEIKIGSLDWQDIIAAGGAFESGGYDGTIDSCCQNPLHGRLGWSGRSGLGETSEFITTSVRLPPSAAGQKVQLRWRIGTDIGGHREGQYLDEILVTDGFTCGCVN